MDIYSIISQPNNYNDPVVIVSNYRQIRFTVEADTLCPPDQPMYCDIYVPTGFYKTITSYTIDNLGGTNSLFLFDIQDALQEFLKTFIPTSNSTFAVTQSDASVPLSAIKCSVKFRGSTFSSGLLVPNPTVPIQATATTPAVSGTGTASNPFYVLNSSVLPEFAPVFSNDLETFLATKQVTDPTMFPGNRIYPLSNIPFTPYLTPNINNSCPTYRPFRGATPVYVLAFAAAGLFPTNSRNCSIRINFGTEAILGSWQILIPSFTITAPHTYYLPCGQANLKTILDAIDPIIFSDGIADPYKDIYYRISIFDEDAGRYCYHSPLYQVQSIPVEPVCLWFQNMFGHFEQITFLRSSTDHKTTSSEQFIPYYEPINSINVLSVGRKRFNTRGADETTLTANFSEQLMPWVRELVGSPYVLQEINPGHNSSLIAVEVIDGSFTIRKSVKDGRINYETSVRIRPAIDYVIPRN